MTRNPTVAILFFTYNRLDYTREALPTLIENTRYPFELYIVDNHSTDGTHEWLEEFRLKYPDIIKDIKYNTTNEGLPGPTNAFWANANTDLVGKVDNDTLVPEGWLERMVEAHIRVSELAVVGGWHFRPEDFNERDAAARLIRKNNTAILPDEHIGGCCYLMKRAIQQRFGPMIYDEKLKIHGWTEYQHRLVEAGYLVGYLYPLIQLEYMDDPRSAKCLIDEKYQDYTREIWQEHGISFHNTEQLIEALKIDAARVTKGKSAGAEGYYGFERPEIQALVPQNARRILDIGCGAGMLGKGLKKTPGRFVAGIEYVPEAARLAEKVLDKVYTGDANTLVREIKDRDFDTVIMADFLEHISDTATMLSQARRILDPDGRLILSIPNIRHWSVLKDLIEGHFNYTDAGILDRTHLRFFTRESICRILGEADFRIEGISGTAVSGWEVPPEFIRACDKANLDTTTLKEEGLIYQYLIVARPQSSIAAKSSPSKASSAHGLTSIIILTFNQLEYTRLCLDSIEKHTVSPYELILVDNGSTDGTVDFLKEYAANHDNVKLIINEDNRGFAGGNNQGIAAAQGNYVLFLNNDTIVTEGWLSRMIRVLEHKKDIGLVGPVSNAVVGEQKIAKVEYQDLEDMPAFARKISTQNAGRATSRVRLVGFCLLIKRAVIELIGGFDEDYAIGNFEDDDLCLRATLAGYTAVIAHDVFIHHFGSQTFLGNNLDYNAHLDGNRERFMAKWPGVIEFKDDKCTYSIAINPHARSVYLNQAGEEAFVSGDYHRALNLFERALKLNPSDHRALNNLGVLKTQLGDPQAGLDIFIKILKQDPADPDARENLKSAMELSGIPAETVKGLLAELSAAADDRTS